MNSTPRSPGAQLLEELPIGQFGAMTGVSVETIRFYQRKGLLPQPPRQAGSIRRYGIADIERLRFIRSAQSLGFSLDEISELLRLEDGAHCQEASSLAEEKLEQVRAKLSDLSRIEAALSGLVQACRVSRGKVACPLIASLHASAERTDSQNS